MDEKKIQELIKKEAENTEIPEKLKPDLIKQMIEERKTNRKKAVWKRPYVWGMAAACVCCLCVVVHLQFMQGTDSNSFNADVASLKHEQVETEENISENNPYFAVAANYDELYSHFAVPKETANNNNLFLFKENATSSEYGNVQETAEASRDVASSLSADNKEETADYSLTNTQEVNIDEADIVKTDGEYIYYIKGEDGRELSIVSAKDGSVSSVTKLSDLKSESSTYAEMYVYDNRLILIETYEDAQTDMILEDSANNIMRCYAYPINQKTRVLIYDIADRANPVKMWDYEQDGYYRESRRNKDSFYLFTTKYMGYTDNKEDKSTYVPEIAGELLPCENIYLPKNWEGETYILMSGVDLKNNRLVSKKAVLGDNQYFYVSDNNIYLAQTDWYTNKTVILRFAYQDGAIAPKNSGEVKGQLKDSFSMNEYNGYLRCVTTYQDSVEQYEAFSLQEKVVDMSPDKQRNGLYILNMDMQITGQIEGLAQGEYIHSARFMGNTGYFVTFRQTDPLFSVDLSNPANPVILGELKISGFSEYLHFYDENLLLGIGMEADENTGITTGLKLSMFDISNPSDVKEVGKMVLENVNSEAIYDYKSICVNGEKNIIGLPVNWYDEKAGNVQGNYRVYSYDKENGFTEKLSYSLGENDSIRNRGLFIQNHFYLLSLQTGKIAVFDMNNSFAKTGELQE